MPKKRVVVAMSGGVDSSVAAAIIQKQGYQVIGVTMKLEPDSGRVSSRACCPSDAIDSAQRVAAKLGIPHYVMDLRDVFARKVIADFCREYSRGRTPNPCIACNQYIKFDTLLQKAGQLGASFLATGHYARVEPSPNGYRLLKAVDSAKDQSYFLYPLEQGQLRHLLLPLGCLYKTEVRRLAAEMGLPNAAKRESQDICFVPDNGYHSFISEYIPSQPGDIVDSGGRILGRHRGLAHYTVGQRQGLGLASDRRLYVLKIDAGSNRLVVGIRDQLLASHLSARQLSWVSGQAPGEFANVTAKVRYRSSEVAVRLHLDDGTARVRFIEPQPAVAPGQAIVFYRGEVVLGGGVIEASELIQRGESNKQSHAILC
ncbi:MAG: tRNA 2-thiouridine(34) synthase MnmA [Dehalococcoidales bacterium]